MNSLELKNVPDNPVVLSSKEAHNVLKECFDRETINNKISIKILFLNADREVTGIFDMLELENTTQIILAHNSLSNDVKPTRLCYQTTQAVKQAGELVGLKLLDHIIINSGESYYSFVDNGKI